MTAVQHDLFSFDQSQLNSDTKWIVGVDEVGRGPLAGPVHAAAVAIHRDWYEQLSDESEVLLGANDSKKLTEKKRNLIYQRLLDLHEMKGTEVISVAVDHASVEEIDRINILEASKLAMYRVLVGLEASVPGLNLERSDDSLFELNAMNLKSPDAVILVDGLPLKRFPFLHQSLIKGDSKSLSIALASIAAKVERDAWMRDCNEEDGRFAWDTNKGYGTAVHRKALVQYGPTKHHRKSFLTKILSNRSGQ